MTDNDPPTDALADLDAYLRYVTVLPDDVTDRIPRYCHPLTGERHSYQYDNHAFLAAIHHLHDELNRVPTAADMRDHGDFSVNLYRDRFETFPRAVEAAGFDPVFDGPQQKTRYMATWEELADPDSPSWRTDDSDDE